MLYDAMANRGALTRLATNAVVEYSRFTGDEARVPTAVG